MDNFDLSYYSSSIGRDEQPSEVIYDELVPSCGLQ
jgi:hypothetical protein